MAGAPQRPAADGREGRAATPAMMALPLLGAACLALVATLRAQVPDWWLERGLVSTNAPVSTNDFAPANLGQLKHAASVAAQELEATIPGGAGTEILSMVAAWTNDTANAADYAPLNLGQLKATAKPFYDRIIASGGWTNGYPWTTNTVADDADFAPANLGQLKFAFAFDPAAFDADGDGMPDAWEIEHGLDPGNPDTDGDGLADGDDPLPGGQLAVPVRLDVVGGNNQYGPAGVPLENPLEVRASAPGGGPIAGASVEFTSLAGIAQLWRHGDPQVGAASVAVPSDAGGVAAAGIGPEGTAGTRNLVRVAAGAGTARNLLTMVATVALDAGGPSPSPSGWSVVPAVDQDPLMGGVDVAITDISPVFLDRTRATISWSDPTEGRGTFVLERRRRWGAWEPIATVAGETSFTDGGLHCMVGYEYRIWLGDRVSEPVIYQPMGVLGVEVNGVLQTEGPGSYGAEAASGRLKGGFLWEDFATDENPYSFDLVPHPGIAQTTGGLDSIPFAYTTPSGAYLGVGAGAGSLGMGMGITCAFDVEVRRGVGSIADEYQESQFALYPGDGQRSVSVNATWWGAGLNWSLSGNLWAFEFLDPLGSVIHPNDATEGFFYVRATALAQEGDSMVVTATWMDGTESEEGDAVCFVYIGAPGQTILATAEEASGPKYRKVALDGRPLADERPQGAEEADQEPEETYVDALTLNLRHSVTDVYVPVPGSDLALTVRREASPGSWTASGGLRPHEEAARPFGQAWSSNIGASIHFVRRVHLSGGTLYRDPDEAIVTDEAGSAYRFGMRGNCDGFFPMPSGRHEQATYLCKLERNADGNFVLTRKFGTRLVYQAVAGEQTLSADRANGSLDQVKHSYARLASVEDRYGNALTNEYASAASLLPTRISVVGRPELALNFLLAPGFGGDAGRVKKVWDPMGRAMEYGYEQRDAALCVGATPVPHSSARLCLLSTVTSPDGAVTRYGYSVESEENPNLGYPRDIGAYAWPLHCELSRIVDPRGGAHDFGYAYDRSLRGTHEGVSFVQTGLPRDVISVTNAGSAGDRPVATFSNMSLVQAHSPPTITGQHTTVVTDARGIARTYWWGGPEVSRLDEYKVWAGLARLDPFNDPLIVVWTEMEIDHGDGRTETFRFDMDAGMAPAEVTDMSGNTTRFGYDDHFSDAEYRTVVPTSLGLNGRYPDPTCQINAAGDARHFAYGPWRVMSRVTDEEGRVTEYDVDPMGRRTAERVKDAAGQLVRQTLFDYHPTFENFMTARTVKRLATDPAWATDLVTRYVPDANGRVWKEIVDPGGLGLTTTHTYDRNGNRLTSTDPNGNTTAFAYDARNRLTGVFYQDGSSKHFAYDKRGNKVLETDENAHRTGYLYDARNRVVEQVRDMDGNMAYSAAGDSFSGIDAGVDLVTRFAYNAVGSRTNAIDPRGNGTRFEYDDLQRLTAKVDVALNLTTSYSYDGPNAGGTVFDTSGFKPTLTVDPRGFETAVAYDKLYRPITNSVRYGANAWATTITAYDRVGNPVSVRDPLERYALTKFDALDRATNVTFAAGTADEASKGTLFTGTGLAFRSIDELGRETDTLFDAAGRPTQVVGPEVFDADAGASARPTTVTAYDAAGNVESTTNPRGEAWEYLYDQRNRKTFEIAPEVDDFDSGGAHNPVTAWAYDAAGNVTNVTDPRGKATATAYDAANRPTSVLGPPVPLPGGGTARPLTVTTYDANGNVSSVTDPNAHAVTNVYDALNRLVWTMDAEGIVVTNGYDAAGNRTAVIDGKGQRTEFAYDGLNRNTWVGDATARGTTNAYDALNRVWRKDAEGRETTYGYDARHRLTTVSYAGRSQDNRTYAYDKVGNLLSVTEPGKGAIADVAYAYDALNRVTDEVSSGVTNAYGYDLAGNRVTTAYGVGVAGARALDSTYDALNRLQTLTEAARTTEYQYDLAGNIRGQILPNDDSVLKAYDALNRATSIENRRDGGGLLSKFDIARDPAGNVVRISEDYPAGGLPDRTVTNAYDAANRLVTEAVLAGSGDVITTYAFDAAHNRTGKTVTGGPGAGSWT
ncbi:MAG: hypothetical protein IT195_00515 [Microthrixaceae bacterium]|nr:hypothetical protein [Microthrixaceae bacterium]